MSSTLVLLAYHLNQVLTNLIFPSYWIVWNSKMYRWEPSSDEYIFLYKIYRILVLNLFILAPVFGGISLSLEIISFKEAIVFMIFVTVSFLLIVLVITMQRHAKAWIVVSTWLCTTSPELTKNVYMVRKILKSKNILTKYQLWTNRMFQGELQVTIGVYLLINSG